MTTLPSPAPPRTEAPPPAKRTYVARTRRKRATTSVLANGEPWIWITGGALGLALAMIVGLLLLVLSNGITTFWPSRVYEVRLHSGAVYMGEESRLDSYRPQEAVLAALPVAVRFRADELLARNDGLAQRRLIRTANYDVSNTHFTWISNYEVETPEFQSVEHEGAVWILRVGSDEHRRYLQEGALPERFVSRTSAGSTAVTVQAPDTAVIDDFLRAAPVEIKPEWAVVIERMAWGRFYGMPVEFISDGEVKATDPADIWRLYQLHHDEIRSLWKQRRALEIHEIGRVNRRIEAARLRLRGAEIANKPPVTWVSAYNALVEIRRGGSPEMIAAAEAELREVESNSGRPNEAFMASVREFEAETEAGNEDFREIMSRIAELNERMSRYELVMSTVSGQRKSLSLAEVVRAYPANRLGLTQRVGTYLARWWEFLTADPREANMEGGVMPAIFGTVIMTLLMSIAVVPFGVLAALYLREYAKAGPMISAVRIAINNLAGVPSIVFGVFGLGFFCYIVGAGIDQLFFEAKLPNPTYGKGGLIWASFTLALLTLPVVIVATEEALAAVPGSMREGSYACGASKWQTIKRIVLPRAMPGIMTGAILAMARGAGEVAPLMLVGAVKLAPELPIDGVFPYVHPERSFMHLGFHVYDLGFQSQNSEAAKPMVFTTTLLLIAIIALLNLSAITLRSRLRRRFVSSQF